MLRGDYCIEGGSRRACSTADLPQNIKISSQHSYLGTRWWCSACIPRRGEGCLRGRNKIIVGFLLQLGFTPEFVYLLASVGILKS